MAWRRLFAFVLLLVSAPAFALEQRLADRLFLIPDPASNRIQFQMIVLAGSADETNPAEWGVAHYLEHLILVGRDEKGGESAQKFFGDGFSNGTTSPTLTTYIHGFPAGAADQNARLEKLFSFYASRLKDFPITPEEATRERNVVRQEHDWRYGSNPFAEVWTRVSSAAHAGHPYGRPTIGTVDTIAALSVGEAKAFLGRWYRRENVWFIVTGNADAAELKAIYERHIQPLDGSPPPPRAWREQKPDLTPVVNRFEKRDRRIADTSTHFSRLVAAPESDPIRAFATQRLVQDFMNSKLSGSPHSRLVEGDAPVASWVSSLFLVRPVAGVIAWSMGASLEEGASLDGLKAALQEYIAEVASRGLDEAMLQRLKRRFALNHARSLREPQNRPGNLIGWLSLGLPHEKLAAWPDVVASVTLDEVNALLAAMAKPGRDAVIVFGPEAP
jgi:zinc protease